MKRTVLFLMVLLLACTAAGQVDRKAFERQRQQMRERFEQQKGRAKQQYDDARRKAEADYAAFRKRANEEYAARGGKRNEGTKYSGGWSIDDVAWYSGNSGNSTHPCGTKRANALGIYDMSGNVWEWCEDWYARQYLQYDNNNPKGATSGSDRVYRGGSWFGNAKNCRVSYRNYYTPSNRYGIVGFRVVLVP